MKYNKACDVNFMSTETVFAKRKGKESGGVETTFYQAKPSNPTNTGSSGATEVVQKVWCAPMTEAGEWVVTWTRVPAAVTYEVQTSLDGQQWSGASRFSDTRAVLLLGPAQRYWVRVRAICRSGPAAWSEPKIGQKREPAHLAA